jgi:enoyl-CoA hydratase/carnithine racemase
MEHMSSTIEGPRLTRLCTVSDGIAWITLDRPQKANAVSSALLDDVLASLDAAEAEPGVRAVIFAGEGRNFCAGADLAELLDGGQVAVRRLLDRFREVCRRFEVSPLPIVGMAQGAVRAGGLELLLCCDAAIAAADATIGDAHALRELLPGGGSSVRLPRTIGHQRAKWMILSGQSISAGQACDWGILHAAVPTAQLRQAAIDLAKALSVAHRDTVGRAKSLLVASHALSIDAALENEIATLEAHSGSEAMRTGLAQFVGR